MELRDLFKKDLDQVPVPPSEEWVPARRRTRPGTAAWRAPVALAAVVVIAVVAGRQLAALRDRIGAAAPGVVAGKAIYLSPSFNGSGWIQIDPLTLKDLSTRPLLDIGPTGSNSFSTIVSADGSTIVVGNFADLAAPTRAVYDARAGQLRGYLVPQVAMVIDALSADGTMAVGRIGGNYDTLSAPKAIIAVSDGHVIRTVPAGPSLWLERTLIAPDLAAVYYLTAAVPATESLDVSIQQPLSLITQSTVTGALSGSVPLPGITMGSVQAPPGSPTALKSVGPGLALSPDGRRLAALSYDGATLDLVDTSTLAVTHVKVHGKTSTRELLRPLVAEAKELSDQQTIDMRFMPDGASVVVSISDRHYGQDGPTLSTRAIERIELATGLITGESFAAEGIYGIEVSPDSSSLYLVVRANGAPAPTYLLRRLDGNTLELRAERALADYAELKVLVAPAGANPGSASATPPARSQPRETACSHDRLVYLVEEFFTRYNSHNRDAVLSLFNLGTPAAGGGFDGYFDDPGVPRDVRDAGALITYLNTRFGIDERFTDHAVSYPPEGATRQTGNPTAVFTRTFSGGVQRGNMQLDCQAGLLASVRMSSDYAEWATGEAFGLRFSVAASWQGPEDIDARKAAGGPLNWLAFRDASGEAQVEVTLWADASADHLVTTRFAVPGGTRRPVTIADAGRAREVIELHAPAFWSGPAGAGTYDNRHLFLQVTPAIVADVVVSAPRVNGDSQVTPAQIETQDRLAVRLAPAK